MRRLPLKMLPIAAAINAVLANTAMADLTDGLVAYYPFNGNANDESGNGNNGTVNGATLTADRFGHVNSAYGFDGNSNSIKIPTYGFPSGQSPICYSLWVNPKNNGADKRLLEYGGGINGTNFNLYINSDVYRVDYWGAQYDNFSATKINEWQHVVLCHNGISSHSFYLNGVLAYSNTHAINLTNSGNAYIGIHQFNNGYSFAGGIDNVRVYNRALSDAEVQELYQEESNTQQLIVAKQGTGTGTITSTPAGIDCGSTCAASFTNGIDVALEPTPNADSVFDGWSEDSDQDCSDGLITTDANKTCTAIFNLAEAATIQAPTAVTNAPSVITSKTAKLQGTVVPNGAATTANFTCNHLTTAVAANPSSIAADADATAVSGNLANLICKTSYTCRVVAANSVGTTTANDQTFTTADICVPNPVTTRPATNVAATSATLNGMVTPNGANTTVSFDLGTTTSYGTSVPATVGIINAAATATAVKGNKIGLTCNTTYNYRVKAVNSVGTTYGANASFKTTTPCPTPPDLVVTSITTSPAAPVANGKFSATVTIKNQGGPMTSGAVVDVWANKATTQTCGAFGNDWEIVDPLAAGATTTVTITDLPAGTAGMKMLRAFVDSDCSVTEANDTNNQLTATYAVNDVASGRDFAVTSITLNPVAPVVNGTFTATVKVKNSGTVAGDGKFLDVWSNQSATQICGAAGNKRLAVGTLNAGASKTLTFTGIAAGAAGSKIFRAFVDSGCGIGEKLEGNNQNTKAYAITTNAASCLAIKTATPTAASGTYTIDPDGAGAIAPLAVYCDMTTDGGGWTLVLAYQHTGGQNNALVLGTPLNPTTGYSHMSNAQMQKLAPYSATRFYCTSSTHARVMNFKTSNSGALAYIKNGTTNNPSYWNTGFTALTGHSANLPATANKIFGSQGDYAMATFPFYTDYNYHWSIRTDGSRWECDDYPGNANNTTLHQVWVK